MNIVCIVECRMTSTRLPGKILMDLEGEPVVMRVIERIKPSKYVNNIVVATTTNKEDEPLIKLLEENSIEYYRGEEWDVLKRVVETARHFKADAIVEITSDCPLVDMEISDGVIERFLEGRFDMVSNSIFRTYPIGMDTHVIDPSALERAMEETDHMEQRDWVIRHILQNPQSYQISNVEAPRHFRHQDLRLTLDTQDDLELIRKVFKELYPRNPHFNLYDIIKLFERNPELKNINTSKKD